MSTDPPLDRLDVWYVSDLALCNFDCPYCSSGNPDTGGSRSRTRLWATDESEARFHQIVDWIERLNDWSVGLRFQTFGEPFVSESFLRAAARLTRSPNIRFVELVTNGSLVKTRLPKLLGEYGADVEKLSLWMTFHYTEIALDKHIANARFAHDQGAHVVVNALLFDDNEEMVAELVRQCDLHGLRLNINLGINFGDGPKPVFPALAGADDLPDIVQNKLMGAVSVAAMINPLGLRCTAGHDYIHIASTGDVYPCQGYRQHLPRAKLGSVLDPTFELRVRPQRYMACALTYDCKCKEDYLHLEIAEPGPPRERSLGYWPPDSHNDHVPAELRARILKVVS